MVRPTNRTGGGGVFASSYYNWEDNKGLVTGSAFGNVGENEILFNASHSSSTYGLSSTVTPLSQKTNFVIRY